METRDLIRRIARAWEGAAYPGDDRLAGQPCSCPCEYRYVADFFKGKAWNEVTRQALKEDYPGPDYACLGFMSGEALKYYLGAFMIMALEHLDTDDAIVEAAVNALTPPAVMPPAGLDVSSMKPDQLALHKQFVERWNRDLPKIMQWWQARVNGFSAAQQEVILAFLRHKNDFMRSKRYPESCLPESAVVYWSQQVSGKAGQA